jgi:hypothetical protein
MKQERPMSLEQIRDFLDAGPDFQFDRKRRKEMYDWVKGTLVGQQYHVQGKAEKGLLKSYLGKMTGLNRAQVRTARANGEGSTRGTRRPGRCCGNCRVWRRT